MTKYICHGCSKIYDDEEGMPGKCCEKTIRHRYVDTEELNDYKEEVIRHLNCACNYSDDFDSSGNLTDAIENIISELEAKE